MNLAALAALARGDLDNFEVAATPGGIEAQEAAGQATFCVSEILPKECPRKELELFGVVFGADHDDIFINATLPAGWQKRATDHAMWSDLLDEKGRKRASIFYKAAFYDRGAHMRLNARYYVSAYEDAGPDHYRVAVKDGDTVIQEIGQYEKRDYEAGDVESQKAEAWLHANFPDHRSPLAYWD